MAFADVPLRYNDHEIGRAQVYDNGEIKAVIHANEPFRFFFHLCEIGLAEGLSIKPIMIPAVEAT